MAYPITLHQLLGLRHRRCSALISLAIPPARSCCNNAPGVPSFLSAVFSPPCARGSLHELPLRVTNATIKTTDEGVVMDAFDVLVDPQCTMSAMDVQLYLSDRLKL